MSLFLTNTQLLASQDINWWTGVVWIIVMFLSAVWTLILTAPIHCRGSTGEQVMQCYNSPNLFWRRNKFIYILNGWRDYSFKFPTINYSFNACFAAVTHVFPLCLSEKRCTTSLSMERQSFFLQNNAGFSKWEPTTERIQEFLAAYKVSGRLLPSPGPPSTSTGDKDSKPVQEQSSARSQENSSPVDKTAPDTTNI